MHIGRAIVWALLITLSILLIVLIFRKQIEEFDNPDPETILRKEVTQYITLANDILCPCYAQILDQNITNALPESQQSLSASDQDPDERHKAKAKAITDLANLTLGPLQKIKPIDPTKVESLVFSLQTTGLLFPCPPPTDPMKIPITIDSYIIATAKIFLPILSDMKDKIEKAMSCPPKSEGFTTQRYYGMPDSLEGYTISKEAFDDVSADPALKQQRIDSLQATADILKKVLLSDTFVKLSSQYITITALKKKAESGDMQSNCPA